MKIERRPSSREELVAALKEDLNSGAAIIALQDVDHFSPFFGVHRDMRLTSSIFKNSVAFVKAVSNLSRGAPYAAVVEELNREVGFVTGRSSFFRFWQRYRNLDRSREKKAIRRLRQRTKGRWAGRRGQQ
jgi:hypothetical protein